MDVDKAGKTAFVFYILKCTLETFYLGKMYHFYEWRNDECGIYEVFYQKYRSNYYMDKYFSIVTH